MWDDPEINPKAAEQLRSLAEDAEMTELYRKRLLITLSLPYAKLQVLQECCKSREREVLQTVAREYATIRRFRQYIPDDVYQQFVIDRHVNGMDPDFSWVTHCKERYGLDLGQDNPNAPPPLPA